MVVGIVVALLSNILATGRSADLVESLSACPVLGATGDGLEWDYNRYAETGPVHWPENFRGCSGPKQSPVDFPIYVKYAPRSRGPRPNLRSVRMTAEGTNNNFALACPLDGTCGLTELRGVNYTVTNGHFHAPSEHTLAGRQYPLELHIVHADPSATKFLVLAILFDTPGPDEYASVVKEDTERDWGASQLMRTTLENLNGGVGGTVPEFEVPLQSVVRGDEPFCAYGGSLTTPPCTEAVTFYLSLKVETVSRAQVFAYARAAGAGLHGNNRSLQPMNGRNVTCYVL